jgi:hypothetical protein
MGALTSNLLDFDKYTMMLSLSEEDADTMTPGKKVIFVGDIHGSFDPLQWVRPRMGTYTEEIILHRRLMAKIKYDPSVDKLVHVGDLVAKGTKNEEVVQWMIENRVQGVRGNHDHPVSSQPFSYEEANAT